MNHFGEKVSFIWSVADLLRGPYKPAQYGRVNRHFYKYEPPRPLEEIEADIAALEKDIVRMLREVVG